MYLITNLGIFEIMTEPEKNDFESQIAFEKVNLAYANMRTGHFWQFFLIASMLFLFWDVSNPIALSTWTILLSVYVVWSYFKILRRHLIANSGQDQTQKWSPLMTRHNLLLGTLWSAIAPITFQTYDPFLLALLLWLMSSLIVGSSSAVAAHLPSYFVWSTPQFLALSAMFLLQSGTIYIWLFMLLISSYIAGIFFAVNTNKVLTKSIRLQIENKALAKDLDEKRQQAEQANYEKSLFLASASHDLRQPLQAATFMADTLQNQLTDEKNSESIAKLIASLDTLGELTNTLLDLSHLESGSIETDKQDTNIATMFERFRQEFASLPDNPGMEIRVATNDAMVHTDLVLLERAIRNLLSNALTHSEATIIELDIIENSDNYNLIIADNGKGISAEEQKLIFTAFHQLDNPHRDRRRGIGLGLAIVKRTMDLLGHKITLNSALGEGCRFEICLPKGNIKNSSIVDKPINPVWSGLDKIRILIVEDDIQVREALEKLVVNWGSKPSIADTANVALDIVDTDGLPDLLICDYRLPGDKNGLELITELSNRVTQPLPSILITGDSAQSILASTELNKDSLIVLNKPVAPAKLRHVVTQLLSP